MKTATPTKKGWAEIKGKCPICEHAGWCTQSADGLVILCRRAPSPREVPQKDGSKAWLHPANGMAQPAEAKPQKAKRAVSEWKAMMKQHRADLTTRRLKILCDALGLSDRALRLYGVGYDSRADAYSFPMFGGDGKPCGMRLRWLDGAKKSVTGSSNGLFVPANYEETAEPIPEGVCEGTGPLLLLMPEGPTSAAAAADLGFRAIGRPSNSGGASLLSVMLRRATPQDVVIVADDEGTKWTPGKPPRAFWPGWEGALQLARQIVSDCERLRVVKVRDAAGRKVKDLRKFIQENGTGAIVNQIIRAAEVATPPWIEAKLAEVEYVRARMKAPDAGKPP